MTEPTAPVAPSASWDFAEPETDAPDAVAESPDDGASTNDPDAQAPDSTFESDALLTAIQSGDPASVYASLIGSLVGSLPTPSSASTETVTADPAVANGKTFVDELVVKGDLSPARASELTREPALLQQIGTLAGDGTDPEGVRAARVLITGLGANADPGGDYLSGAAQRNEIGPDAFKALSNDLDFLAELSELAPASRRGEAPGSSATADRFIDQAVTNLGVGDAPTDGAGEVYRSRDGLLFQAAGAPEQSPISTTSGDDGEVDPEADAAAAPEGVDTPIYVDVTGRPLPDELQAKLDKAEATDEGIDPQTLWAAKALTGEQQLLPTERFAADAYLGGTTELDEYVGQINDAEFLSDPETQRAAEVLYGSNPEGHTRGEDFLNSLYANGHITQEKFVEHANDPEFLAETDAAIENGNVTYTTENYGKADELLLDGTLSPEEVDAELSKRLESGYVVGEEVPTPEQVAALYEAGGRNDREFTELGLLWVANHNPDVEFRYGIQEEGSVDMQFFFEKDGELVSDPFLESLLKDLEAPGPEEDERIVRDFHKARKPYAEGDLDGAMPLSIPVFAWLEGVSEHSRDETTDASRHTLDIVFPDKGTDARGARKGTGFDIKAHFENDEFVDGIDGKAKFALEGLDPDLFGEQITLIDGENGLSVTNGTRFDDTTVRADDADELTVTTTGNAGDVTVIGDDADDFTFNGGSGSEEFFEVPDGQSAAGEGFAPDGVDNALTRAQQDLMVSDAFRTFVDPLTGEFDAARFEEALDAAPGLLDGDREYIGGAVEALNEPQPQVAV